MAVNCVLVNCILLVLIVCCTAQQQCKSAHVETYVAKRRNATQAATRAITNVVLVSFGGNNGSQPNSTESLYNSVTDTYGLEKSNASFNSFSRAFNAISEAHFQACYGPTSSRPTFADATALIVKFLKELNETEYTQSLLDDIRSIFGKLICLKEMESQQQPTSQPSDPPTGQPTDQPSSQPPAGSSNCNLTLDSYQRCLDDDKVKCLLGVCKEAIDDYSQQNRWHRCVGFVVDDTGSMSEEISAVRTNILNFIDDQQDSGLLPDCYVLITFNDYEKSNPLDST